MKLYKVYFWNGEHYNSVEETLLICAATKDEAISEARPLCDSLGFIPKEDIEVHEIIETDNGYEIFIKF